MKKILCVMLCLGMCVNIVGCSNKFTYDDARAQAEEVMERLNTYEIGKFTLLTTNQKNQDDGNYYYECNAKYTCLDDNDVDLSLVLKDRQVFMLKLEDKDIFTYARTFNQYYEFYKKVIDDSDYFKISNISYDKTITFAEFINDQLDNIGDRTTESFSLDNGNTLLNFSYIKVTNDDILMQIIINQE